ncbi:unnamed protein product, partial [Mesorhabditis spiculigera]
MTTDDVPEIPTARKAVVLEPVTWLQSILARKANWWMCEIDMDYIMDPFNAVGIDEQVSLARSGLALLRRRDRPIDKIADDLAADAINVYGLLHARYILTKDGIRKMMNKNLRREFGCCSKVGCQMEALYPTGLYDEVGRSRVKLYCPRCRELYHAEANVTLDGAFFGTSFPHNIYFERRDLLRPTPIHIVLKKPFQVVNSENQSRRRVVAAEQRLALGHAK